jgi:outer membrane immunogenic protein
MNCTCLKSLKLPLTAAFAVAAFSAQAADMYSPRVSAKDAPVYEAVPVWTGFYAGINSGYGWGAKSSTLDTTAFDVLASDLLTGSAGIGSSKLSTEGGFAGGQAGYNLQRDRFVFGLETDIQGGAIKGNTYSEAIIANANPALTLPALETGAGAKSTLDWFGTVRGRLGYSFGSTLLYGTGGFAYGGVRDSLFQEVNSTTTGTRVVDSASKNSTQTGWVAGGGIEVALSPSWSVKAEYQYIDLGSTTLSTFNDQTYTPTEAPDRVEGGGASIKFDHTYHTARLGLNYRFNQAVEPLK